MQQQTTLRVGGRAVPPVGLIRGASLFLDFDGTLVEIAERPDAVIVTDRLRRLMAGLNDALHGRIAIVTGRPAGEIAALLGVAGLRLGGSHGAELVWPDGRRIAAETPAWLEPTISRLRTFTRDRPGLLVEPKPFGVALHYRRAPEAERACLSFAEHLAGTSDIQVLQGKMVVELRLPNVDKGAAIAAFMAEEPMKGSRPLFFGDDVTDEAGFLMAHALGGAGVLVGEDRPSAARYGLPAVSDVLAWLELGAAEAA